MAISTMKRKTVIEIETTWIPGSMPESNFTNGIARFYILLSSINPPSGAKLLGGYGITSQAWADHFTDFYLFDNKVYFTWLTNRTSFPFNVGEMTIYTRWVLE